jgi:hypothetical protein
MSIILDAMLPTDISEQIRQLEKYVKSAFDVVGLLPKELGARILRELSVHEVLKVSLVSNPYYFPIHSLTPYSGFKNMAQPGAFSFPLEIPHSPNHFRGPTAAPATRQSRRLGNPV